MSNRGIIAASIIGGLVVVGAIIYFAAPGVLSNVVQSANTSVNSSDEDTTIASPGEPRMLLYVLESAEGDSPAVAQYEANNTEPIELQSTSHIKFDSPDYRTAEGMTVTARNLNTGEIELLRKSYDVNNQFFINLAKGNYDFQVQAKWAEKGTFVYLYDVVIV